MKNILPYFIIFDSNDFMCESKEDPLITLPNPQLKETSHSDFQTHYWGLTLYSFLRNCLIFVATAADRWEELTNAEWAKETAFWIAIAQYSSIIN